MKRQKNRQIQRKLRKMISRGACAALLTACGLSSASAYQWLGTVPELNTDFTNTVYWQKNNTDRADIFKDARISYGNTINIGSHTLNMGNNSSGTTTLTIDGTFNLTSNRPVVGISNNSTSVINVNGIFNQTAGNFCFGENFNTKSIINVNPGATFNMSGLVGSSGQATINIADGAKYDVIGSVLLGWRGNQEGNSTLSYMGIINQEGGTSNIMSTARNWTKFSGLTFVTGDRGAYASSQNKPAGQYIISDGTLNTLRVVSNVTAYDEALYNPSTTTQHTNSDRLGIYQDLGLTADQQTLAGAKEFIMTGGTANIVSVTNISADDASYFGTLSVPTLFLGGTLNVLKVDASLMANDTFDQLGGILSPNTAAWDGGKRVLTVNKNSRSSTTITGGFNQDAGTIFIDREDAGNDTISVSGAADLNGSITVRDTSTATNGTINYDVLTAGTLTTGNDFSVLVGGTNVSNYTYTTDGNKVTLSVTYGTTGPFYWKGGTGTGNTYATRGSWTDDKGDAGNAFLFKDHVFGDAAHGNAYASIQSGESLGSNSLQMAMGTSSATLNINAGGVYDVIGAATMAELAGASATLNVNGQANFTTITVGEGTANITVGENGTLTTTGAVNLKNGANFTSNGTVNLGGDFVARNGANLSILSGSLTGRKFDVGSTDKNQPSTLTIGAKDTQGPAVTVTQLKVGGEGYNDGKSTLNVHSGILTVNGMADFAHNGSAVADFNLTGGRVIVNGMFRTSENWNTTANINISGGELWLNQNATIGSHGKTNMTMSDGTLTALGQFVVNFYENNDQITQTGGVANIWGNENYGWGIRRNPGFISNDVYKQGERTYQAGLQFSVRANGDTLENQAGSMNWAISGGQLNTLRVSTCVKPNSTLLTISDDAEVNIISNGVTDKYYGILAVPTEMTGGTLNVETIYARGPYNSRDAQYQLATYDYMPNGTFTQLGGVLSPDGGSIVNQAFAPSATGIATTTVIGNYALAGGCIKLDIGEFATDFSTLNDAVKVLSAEGTDGGKATIGGDGVKINLAAALLEQVNGGSYNLASDPTKVLLMTAEEFDASAVYAYGWNDQIKGSGFAWSNVVENYGDGVFGLYGVLVKDTGPCWWDQAAGSWSTDFNSATGVYIGSSEIGNSPNAPGAVLSANTESLPPLYIAQKEGDSGKLTISNNAVVKNNSINQIGVAGTGELVVDAGATFQAVSVFLGVESTGSGTLTINGTAEIGQLSQGTGAANITVGSAGKLSVDGTYSQTNGTIKSAGTTAFASSTAFNGVTMEQTAGTMTFGDSSTLDGVTLKQTAGTMTFANTTAFDNVTMQLSGGKMNLQDRASLNSGSVTMSGDAHLSINYTGVESEKSYIGRNGKMEISASDNAVLQFRNRAPRGMEIADGASADVTMDFSGNSILYFGDTLTRHEGYEMVHFGDGGKLTANFTDNAMLFSPTRVYYSEAGGSNVVTSFSGNSKFLVGTLLLGGSGNGTINIADNAMMNITDTFCFGYGANEQVVTVNQTGGLVEAWGDGTGKYWGHDVGIHFGGNGGKQSTGTYNLSGGTLNTYRIYGSQGQSAPLLAMSGGTLNVLTTEASVDSGKIQVPFLFTGGTLNAAVIEGYGHERKTDWNSNRTKTFTQFGGTIAPENGTKEGKQIAVGGFGETYYDTYKALDGAAETTIVGDYVIDLSQAVNKSVPVISLDFYSDGDSVTNDKIVVSEGNLTIDPNAILEIVVDDKSAINFSDVYELILIDEGMQITGNFSGLSMVDLASNSTSWYENSVFQQTANGLNLLIGSEIGVDTQVPEPATWGLLVLGGLGLFFLRKKNGKKVS